LLAYGPQTDISIDGKVHTPILYTGNRQLVRYTVGRMCVCVTDVESSVGLVFKHLRTYWG